MSEAQWTVVFAAEAINHLLLITEYLTQSYCGFGEPLAEANRHAQVRIEAIITAAERLASKRLATAPFRGESHDDLPAAKPACCKSVTRSELVLFTSGSQQFTNGWMRSSSSASSALATSVS
jgi:hypothetical protein